MTDREQLIKDALKTYKESNENYATKVSVLAITALLIDKGIATSDELDKYIDTWTEQMDKIVTERFATDVNNMNEAEIDELKLISMLKGE